MYISLDMTIHWEKLGPDDWLRCSNLALLHEVILLALST